MLSTTDGDTFRVWVAGKEETVRVLAIDTPETRKPDTPVQCGGPEASEEAHRLLDRTTVSLAPDPTQDDRDRYGRLLRYVTLADGTTDFGLHMVQGGWAHAYRLASGKAPQRYDQYRTAELSAKASHTGPLATC